MLLSRFFGVPADEAELRHQFTDSGRVFGSVEILRAAKKLGFRAKDTKSSWDRLCRTPLPAIARMNDGTFVIVAKADTGKLLIQNPAVKRPVTLTRDEFEKAWSGKLILIAKRAIAGEADGKFGFSWFIPFIIKYRKLLGEVMLASFVMQLFALLTPLFFQVVIDKVLVHKGLTTLHVLTIGMLALTFFDITLGGLRAYLFSHTSCRIDVTLGAQLFDHMLRLPIAYFEARRAGDTVARVRELETIRRFLTGSTITAVLDLFFALVFLALMFFYSPTLTLVVFLTLPVYAALSLGVTPVIRARLNEKFNRGAENQAFLVESINGIETVKSLAVEPSFQRKWEEQLAAYVRAGFRADNLGNVASQTASFIDRICTIAIVWFGARLVLAGELSIGQLVAFNMLSGRVSGPVLRIVRLWQDFQQTGISVKRLGDVLNTPAEPEFGGGRAMPSGMNGNVVFDSVIFRYRHDGPAILRNVSFDISAGEVIGIVGRSGSGKSTVAKLLQRLYVPEGGRILIDGLDVSHMQPAWLRRQTGVVLQENFLFNSTVRDNIALADPGVPMERVIHAAKLAGAHDFISELPTGYDTMVGEHGSSLSGGQRQRIAIARALITNPRILIFDEATSALDYESESIIQRNMKEICRGRTVFIIAHRLSTVRGADRIFVIDRGTIVEEGAHSELVETGGYYARLNAIQNGVCVAA